MLNSRLSFYYDPQRQGYDTTLLKTLNGTPSVTGDGIVLNNAGFIGYADIYKEDLTINLTIPSAPLGSITYNTLLGGNFEPGDIITDANTTHVIGTVISDNGTTMILTTVNGNITIGDVLNNAASGGTVTAVFASKVNTNKTWGLQQIAQGSFALFNISGSTFRCAVSDSRQNIPPTIINIPWNSDWTNNPIDFTIKWTGFSVDFLINGVRPGGASLATDDSFTETFINNNNVPKVALSTFVSNNDSDNMIVGYMEDQNVQGYI